MSSRLDHIMPFAAFAKNDRGATAAEFALIVPVFLALIFLTINGAILISAVVQTHYAAERAARCLSVDVAGNCTAADIDTYAKKFYNGPMLTDMGFTRDAIVCGSGANTVDGNQVTGSGSYTVITGLAPTTVTIGATACYPKI